MSPGGVYFFLKSSILQKKKKQLFELQPWSILHQERGTSQCSVVGLAWVYTRTPTRASLACPPPPNPQPPPLTPHHQILSPSPHLLTVARIVCLLCAYLLSAICSKTEVSEVKFRSAKSNTGFIE